MIDHPVFPEEIASPTPGRKVSCTRVFTDTDLRIFAELSGDDNPIHLDDEHARASRFGRRVVHGMLTGSLFTMLFGKYYPGPGGIYLEQQFKFVKPVFLGDPVTATIELLRFDPERRIGHFRTDCHDQDARLLLSGEARVLFPPVPA